MILPDPPGQGGRCVKREAGDPPSQSEWEFAEGGWQHLVQ
jgi:hypothetical protein